MSLSLNSKVMLFFFSNSPAISNEELKLYGVQFHPEVDLSTKGKDMLRNFLVGICELSCTFTMDSREVECIEYIQKVVGENKVLVSGSIGVEIEMIIQHSFILDAGQWWRRLDSLRSSSTQGPQASPGDCFSHRQRVHEEERKPAGGEVAQRRWSQFDEYVVFTCCPQNV